MEVPVDAWQVGPWNRWAFQHVDEVVATETIPRDPSCARPWLEADGALDDLIEPFVAKAWVDGVLVARRGTILGERYANEMGPETLHLSQSVAKSVLGLLVGILTADGVFSREDPVIRYLPELDRSGFGSATVGHLLDMTAAVDFVEDYANFWRYDIACGWHPPVVGVPDTILAYLPTIGPAAWRHGERFHYASPDTDLLGLVVQRATGGRLTELIAQRLWGPLGAERDALMTIDRSGSAVVSGGLCACLRDYARIGQVVAGGGEGIVPAAWVDSLGDGVERAWANSTLDPAGRPGLTGYANQWWRFDGRPTARGIHGQLITVDRPTGIFITVLSSQPQALDDGLAAVQREFAAAVIERLTPAR